MTPLERITERVSRLGHPDDDKTPRPLLTLSEFFDGNSHVGSICCNLTPQPTLAQVHSVLQKVAARHDVGDIRVQVTMFDDPEWPFSDTVYVMTTATRAAGRAHRLATGKWISRRQQASVTDRAKHNFNVTL